MSQDKAIGYRSFLGTGWSFPPAFTREVNGVQMVSDKIDIEQSLEILLATSLGERIMVPDFGCDLRDFLFEPLDVSTRTLIEDRIKTAVLYHEPRIDINTVQLRMEENRSEGKLWILVDYTIRGTNSRFNFVFPFYLEEGIRIMSPGKGMELATDRTN